MYPVMFALDALALASVLWTNLVVANRKDDIGPPIPVTSEFLPADYFPELDSKRVKVNYGLVDVPSMHENGGMIGTLVQIPLPCSDCLVTWIQAGLEYVDGSRADADTGMWLHHTVFSAVNKPNRVCPGEKWGDWFFASGNERSKADLCESGRAHSGYYIGPEDKMIALTDLMNMLGHEQTVALTVTWEYIPSPPKPAPLNDFTYLTPYWLDIGGCGDSELPAKPNTHFHYSMPAKKAQIPGEVKMMLGHLHDGGTRLDVICNGEIVCTMEAEYSIYGSDEHLSHMSNCSDVGSVSPGDIWSITAHYDTRKHKPMMEHDGGLEPIMGIVVAYVAEENPDMDDGKDGERHHHHHHHHFHTLAGVSAAFVVVGALMVLGHFWLKKRGETVMDYVPERLREGGWIKLSALNRRIMLRGERLKDPLLGSEASPAYRDED